jgi:hypothetical protein
MKQYLIGKEDEEVSQLFHFILSSVVSDVLCGEPEGQELNTQLLVRLLLQLLSHQ